MTVRADIVAISPTANAKAVVQAKGGDIATLMLLAQQHASELKVLIAQIIAVHPSGGGDAANLTALNNVLTELT